MSSRKYEIGVGALVLGGGVLLAYMALQVGALGAIGQERIHVSTSMTNVAGLSVGAVVAIAGVPIGDVESMEVDFDHARVDLSIDRAAGVRVDAVVAMRARSVLGEKYLEVEPQSKDAALVLDGGVLEHSRAALEIDQLVTRLGPMLDAIDPATVQTIVNALADAIKDDPTRPTRMLADAEHTLHNLALASDSLAPTVDDVRAALTSVKKTSEAARPVLAHADTMVSRLDDLVAAVPPERVPALLDEVTAAVKEGRAVIVRLDASTGTVQEILTKLNQLNREDLLRVTQEEGVLIRLRPRKVETLLEQERAAGH